MHLYLGCMKFKSPYTHIFKQGDANLAPLLVLHGTGGDENAMLDIASAVAPKRSVLSPRGLVNEHGNLRFFRRFAEGHLDEDDVHFRSNEMNEFVTGAMAAYEIPKPIALGYSNGANLALAMLVMELKCLSGAILLRSMAPFKSMPIADLNQMPILLLNGAQDQMIPPADTKALQALLVAGKAKLQHQILPTGHGLSQTDITHISQFLDEQK